MSNPLLDQLVADRAKVQSTHDEIVTRAAERESNEFTTSELETVKDADAKLRSLDERIEELSDIEVRAAASRDLALKVREATGGEDRSPVVRVGDEPRTYGEANADRSYFRDLFLARTENDQDAHARISKHIAENRVEMTRSNTVANLGEFAPPIHLAEQYAELVRSARPVADAIGTTPHPNAPSWTVPVISQGTAVGFQAAELDTFATQDFDAANITVTSRTIAAYNDVSTKLLKFDRGISVDREIFGDLARAYAVQVENMVLNSTVTSNKGLLQVSGSNAVAYTDASPTVPEFYTRVAAAEAAIASNRFDAPEVLIVSARRWSWMKSAADSTGRPLVLAVAPSNAPGIAASGVQGIVGTFYGLPVIVSYAVPLVGGDDDNEDVAIVARISDSRLYEGAIATQVDPYSLGNKGGVRFTFEGEVAFSAERSPKSIALISGTGLVNPFA